MNAIDILKNLVVINSINPKCQADGPGEAERARYVADLCKQKGIDFKLQEVFPGRNNVVASLDGGNKSKRLAYEAHMDTVSGLLISWKLAGPDRLEKQAQFGPRKGRFGSG